MSSIKCQNCGLTNWASDAHCKKCGGELNKSTENQTARNYVEDDKILAKKWGLQEFAISEPNGIPLYKLPGHLGITGCLKLIIMISVILLIAVYGGAFMLKILPNGFGSRLKAVIGIAILGIPAIYLSLLSAWVTDKILKLVRLSA